MRNILYNSIAYMKSSILRKLMFFYVLIIMIPVLTLGGYIQKQSASHYNQRLISLAEEHINQGLGNIKKMISEYEYIAQAVRSNTSIRNLLDPGYYYDDSDKIDMINNNVKTFLSEITGIDRSIYKVRIFFTRYQVQEVADCFYDFSRVKDVKWYRGYMEESKFNEAGWNISLTDKKFNIDTKKSEDTKAVVSVLIKMYDTRYENVNGLLEVQINRKDFFDQAFKAESGSRDSGVVVIDRNGEVVYGEFGSNKELASQQWAGEVRDAAAFSDSLPSTIKSRYYITRHEIDKLGCVVVGFFPVEETNKANLVNRKLIFLVLSTGVVFLAVITFLLVKMIFSKLKKLLSALKRIQKGDLDFLLETESNDEVGELSRNFNIMTGRIKELIQINVKIKLAEKDAQLKALQAQINPHFLYNSLNAIKMMAELKDDLAISDAVSSLGTILRYNISGGNKDLTSLKAELGYIRHYISIQKLLLEDRVELSVTVDPELEEKLEECVIVKLLIQPVLENAIVHGLKNVQENGCVNLAVYKSDSDLHITVTNNGNIIPQDRLEELSVVMHEEYDIRQDRAKGFGIGLKNVQQRIKLLYGEAYGITITSSEEATEVDIKIPYISAAAGDNR